MATYTVTTTSDVVDPAADGVLSLRETLALVDADSGTADRIEFAPAVQGGRIVLAGSQLSVGSDVTIDGGAGVTIDADGRSRVLLAQPTMNTTHSIAVALDHLTITDGQSSDFGGGINATTASFFGPGVDLSLNHCTVSNCTTLRSGGGINGLGVRLTDSTVIGNRSTYAGGGINGTAVTLTDSTISGNSCTGSGGGVHGTGGRLGLGPVTLTNSTIAHNEASSGGGISAGDVSLTSSTIAYNQAVEASGGVEASEFARDPFIEVVNSIIAGNTADGSPSDLTGPIDRSNGHNIFGSDVEGSAAGDLESAPVTRLFAGNLADHGGPTPTIALRDAPDNPALGSADPANSPETDQRGVARPQPMGTAPDIGAFELGPSEPQPAPPPNLVDGTTGGEILRGSADADLVRGRPGDDHLWGFAGDDELLGGYGDDVLVGGPGIDRMLGGGGADRFILRQAEAAPPGGPAYDEILDFARSQHDRIDLQPIDTRAGLAGDQVFAFVGRRAFTDAGQLRYEATTDGDFLVSGNTDRDLDAELACIVRSAAVQLEAGDFLL